MTPFNLNKKWRCWHQWCFAILILLNGTCGCSRTFWREQADRDSYLAITEKLNDPRWALPRIDVTANPESRFYDPYNPDAEPAPPDDGAASVYMNWVDGWEGYKGWHKFGDLMSVENPQWLANFNWSTRNIDPLTGEEMPPLPEIKGVTLADSVELAQIHNRDYQFEIEKVYLAALAVTFQRFQFGVRYLGSNGLEPGASTTGTFIPNSHADNVAAGVAGGISQLLPAGTQWAVEFANNTIWLFSGGNQTQSMSNLSFSIIQPLLFGAGRKVGLEGLTQTERNLLYEARVLARLRKQIFTSVVGGGSTNGPSSPGFLNLLVQVQKIRNQRGNIGRLEEQVERLLSLSARNKQFANSELDQWPANTPLPENLPGPLKDKLIFNPVLHQLRWSSDTEITPEEVKLLRNLSPDPAFQVAVGDLINTLQTDVATLDVLNLQSTLTNSVISLRNLERILQDSLDNFKIYLGLRTDVIFSIDDSLLAPFEFIDPRISELEQRGKDFVKRWGALDEEQLDVETLRRVYVEFLALVDDATEHGMNVVIADMARARQQFPKRLAEVNEEDRPMLQADMDRANALLEGARNDLSKLRETVVETAQGLRSDDLDPELILEKYKELNGLREKLVRLTQNITVIQVSLRVELIEVQPFELAMQTAVSIAMDNRLDLMNARAFVMDARRKVEIAANALLSSVNLVAKADINTPSSNRPFDFRGDQSRLRAGFSFTAPLDQIDERNAYRLSLITYQRARRAYMLKEDQVKQSVRNAWRQLYVLRQNLETSRRSVRIAALQYDAAVEKSNAPVNPNQIQSSGSGLAGNNLITALNKLLSAQNGLVQIYFNYEQNRLNIYRDMGIMNIGEDGLWDDPFYRSQGHETEDNSLRSDHLVDPPPAPAARVGRSRLGGRSVDSGLVALPDNGRIIPASSQKSDPRDSTIRPVSGQPQHAGLSGKP